MSNNSIADDIALLTQNVDNPRDKPHLRASLTVGLVRELDHDLAAVDAALDQFFGEKATVH